MTGRATATVDLGAIRRNAATLSRQIASVVRLCAVVKADAYGHGALPCARAALAGGATWLAVATAEEAAALRSSAFRGRWGLSPDTPTQRRHASRARANDAGRAGRGRRWF